jgi:hypothetical protein
LGLNLLSQENSAKEGTNMKSKQRILSNNYLTVQEPIVIDNSKPLKDPLNNNLNLEDLVEGN